MSPPRIAATALAALTFCTLSLPAQADREEEDNEIETLLVLGIADHWRDGGTVSTLSGESFARAGFVHPYELLASQPGTWISRGSGQEHLTAIRSPVLTGPGACGAFLILEDGIPIRPTGFCNVNNLFEATLELAGGVEVVRGPASASFGGNALHGAINVKSAPMSAGRAGNVQLEVGNWGYRTAKASWRQAEADGGLQVGFFTASDGGYRDESGYDLHKLKLRYDFTDDSDRRSSLQMSTVSLQQETAGFITGENAYRDSDAVRRANPNPEAYRDASALRLNYRTQFGDEDSNRLLRLWGRQNDMDFLMHFLPCQPRERNNHNSVGASWDWTTQHSLPELLWLVKSELSWGVKVELANIHLDQSQQTAPTDCTTFRSDRFPQGPHYDYDVASRNFALRGSGRYSTRLSSPFVFWDARLESLTYDYANNLPAGLVTNADGLCGGFTCRYSRPPDDTITFNMLGARLGLTANPKGWQWHLSLSSGYRPPQVGELYRLQAGQTTADLRPEQLLQLEWGGRLRADVTELAWAIYIADKTRHIYRDSDRVIHPNGATNHLGAELNLRLQPADRHELALALSLGRHTYDFDADTISSGSIISGTEIDTAPGELMSASWDWQLGAETRLQTELLHTGPYNTDAAGQHSYDGHQLLNLRLSLRPLPQLQLRARIHNLLDAAYADRADYTIFTEDRYFPGLPRTLYFAVQWDFD